MVFFDSFTAAAESSLGWGRNESRDLNELMPLEIPRKQPMAQKGRLVLSLLPPKRRRFEDLQSLWGHTVDWDKNPPNLEKAEQAVGKAGTQQIGQVAAPTSPTTQRLGKPR